MRVQDLLTDVSQRTKPEDDGQILIIIVMALTFDLEAIDAEGLHKVQDLGEFTERGHDLGTLKSLYCFESFCATESQNSVEDKLSDFLKVERSVTASTSNTHVGPHSIVRVATLRVCCHRVLRG